MDAEKKRISCRRCQLRKLKCTRLHPCANCVKSGNECTFRDDDTRRRPVSRRYVAALEERLSSYEAMTRTLQQSPSDQRSLWLPNNALGTPSPGPRDGQTPASDLLFDYSGSSRMSTLTLQQSPQGHRSFYGPTSMYQKYCITDDIDDEEEEEEGQTSSILTEYSDIRLSRIFKIDDLVFNAALSLFFQHLNAECPFIDGPTLLGDFFHDNYKGKFWSYSLLYAICCLGARISPNPNVSKTADSLGRCVNEMLRIRSLESPHATTVQALLCLAYVELGAGNNTNGWMLSGMAFRMVQDLGLHQDPKFLTRDDSTIDPEHDSQMRRQLYWGCYITDKVICLYFGRPMFLHDDDASVDHPPLNTCTAFDAKAVPLQATQGQDAPRSCLLADTKSLPILPHLVELSKIIESIMTQIFGTKLIKLPRNELVYHRVAKLEELNIRLFQWHSAIPEALAWNQWTSTTQDLPPQLAIMHALYHSCLISLNRHFIRPTPGFARKTQSREICIGSADSIMAIARHYRSQHSLATAPVVLVYSLMMTATAVTFTLDSATSTEEQPSEYHQHLNFLLKALKECSATYGAALHSSNSLQRAMQRRNGKRPEPSSCNPPPSTGAEVPKTAKDPEATARDTEAQVSTGLEDTSDAIGEGSSSSSTWWNHGPPDFGELHVSGQDWETFLNDPDTELLSNLNWIDAFM